jgi:hypothetical protein
MTTHHRTAFTAVRPSLSTVPDLHDAADHAGEPTAAELAAIDIESSLIAAEVAVVDAEVALLSAPRGPADLAWQQLRRARRQVLREVAALAGLRPGSAFPIDSSALLMGGMPRSGKSVGVTCTCPVDGESGGAA